MLIKNSEVLRELRDRKHKEMALRLGEDFDPKDGGRMHILICGVAGCQSAGSLGIYEELNKRIEENGLQSEIKIDVAKSHVHVKEHNLMTVHGEHSTHVDSEHGLARPSLAGSNRIYLSHLSNPLYCCVSAVFVVAALPVLSEPVLLPAPDPDVPVIPVVLL